MESSPAVADRRQRSAHLHVLGSAAVTRSTNARRYWSWHRWLGLAILLPLVWWTATALVFVLHPIEEIRGRSWSTGRTAPPATLATVRLPAPAALLGVRRLTAVVVEGHQVIVLDRGKDDDPSVFDQASGQLLGAAIPLDWALDCARRDFSGPFDPGAVYLLPRQGPARLVSGAGPSEVARPDEYTGPLPAYGVQLRGAPGMRLYVDALDGEVRARRTSWWRFYDWAFRLHALDFLPDGAKRAVIWLVAIGWLGLGATGLKLAMTWLRRSRPKGPPAPTAP